MVEAIIITVLANLVANAELLSPRSNDLTGAEIAVCLILGEDLGVGKLRRLLNTSRGREFMTGVT